MRIYLGKRWPLRGGQVLLRHKGTVLAFSGKRFWRSEGVQKGNQYEPANRLSGQAGVMLPPGRQVNSEELMELPENLPGGTWTRRKSLYSLKTTWCSNSGATSG
jgi:hypothetical protein